MLIEFCVSDWLLEVVVVSIELLVFTIAKLKLFDNMLFIYFCNGIWFEYFWLLILITAIFVFFVFLGVCGGWVLTQLQQFNLCILIHTRTYTKLFVWPSIFSSNERLFEHRFLLVVFLGGYDGLGCGICLVWPLRILTHTILLFLKLLEFIEMIKRSTIAYLWEIVSWLLFSVDGDEMLRHIAHLLNIFWIFML